MVSERRGDTGALEVAIRSGGVWTNTEAQSFENLLGDAATTSRVRLVLEVTGEMPLDTGVLKPTLERGLWYDGGDAETGSGLDMGGGLAYATERLTVEVSGRKQVTHEDREYEERSFSGSIAYGPQSDRRGLTMNLGSSLGATGRAAQSLWSRSTAQGLARGSATNAAQRFGGELGYGFSGPKGRVLWKPFLGAESHWGRGRTMKLGVKLTSGKNVNAGLELGQLQSAGGKAGYQFQLRGRMYW